MKTKWFVVVNPVAGGGRARKLLPEILRLVKESEIDFKLRLTQYKGHATMLAKQVIERGFRDILCIGGDGTMNEIVNGIFAQQTVPTTEITIAMVPVGIGKDWGKTIGIPPLYSEAVKIIEKAKTFIQDIGVVEYHSEGVKKRKFFANVAGIGYDALVTRNANRMKENGHSGTFPYLFSLFSCLLRYKHKNFMLRIDGKSSMSSKLFSANVGICKFSGGGMKQVPNAVPDDGLLDLTLIKDVSKIDVLRNVKNLYDGSFISHPKIQIFRGKKFYFESKPKIYLEVDGEYIGHSPLSFHIIPRSLRVIVK